MMAAAGARPLPAERNKTEGRAGSRRIFPAQFKLQVLEAYRRDAQCRGNQRATARKFGIHRRQIQKWLQAETALRAALLRRAPQPAPSPPPQVASSPESARQPCSPPPAPIPLPRPTSVAVPPVSAPAPPPALPVTYEPIDLSLRRMSPAPPATAAPAAERKPFKLFRPYLLEDEPRVSAFSPVGACAMSVCAPSWYSAAPAFPAPLR